MTRLIQFFCLSIILLFNNIYAATPSNTFQSFLDNWRTQNQITGVVVSIDDLSTHTITDYRSGTVTLQGKMPVSTANLFGVGSISKTFVAATILQLQEEGKLKLDNPLSIYFPQYPKWGTITIRELLNMTSGVPNFTEAPTFADLATTNPSKLLPPQTFIEAAYNTPIYFKPGQGWHYSNTNYLLLGLLIEHVAGQPLNDVLQKRFFTPLHLEHTFYSAHFYPKGVEAQMAHGYYNGEDLSNFNAGLYGASGSMVMDSHDLITWTHALLTPGIILNKASIQDLEQTVVVPPQKPRPPGSLYGLGIFSLQIPKLGIIWWYAGVIDGYTSVFVWIPSENKIITAQASSWPKGHYEVLFPNQALLQELLH